MLASAHARTDAADDSPPTSSAPRASSTAAHRSATDTGRPRPPALARCLAVAALIALLFLADLLLPPGATPAIAYCLVILIAVRVRSLRFFVGVVAVCTGLTWVAYVVEPPAPMIWHRSFERAMVTGVIWLTALIAWRREEALGDLEQARRQLERSNADLERFAAIASHDLRAPLTSVTLGLDLLANAQAKRDNDDRALIDSMREDLGVMNRMIANLLTESRIGAAPLHFEACDSELAMDRAVRFLRAAIDDADARVTRDALPTVCADCEMLTQVFQNLIQNAIKYRRPEHAPAVHVHARAEADDWVFSVRDNGIGITPQDQPRVFDLFHRAGSARGRAEGSGIGLAVCRKIILRHGGRIWLESQPGEGSTFSFTLPRSSRAMSRRTR